MSYLKTKLGDQIFYKDWGTGKPILFSHGWPLTADAWDNQMMFFLQKGYRVIAHDRRGHGRSSQTWENNNMDQYADDLSELIEYLDLKDLVIVGHSTGGGEVTRYLGRHGTSRISKAVLIDAVPPLMLKTKNNPNGLPLEVFDGIRKGIAEYRSQFTRDFTMPFYGFNRQGAKEIQGLRDSFWRQTMMGGVKAQFDSIHEFSEVDFTNDLKSIDVPTLFLHGEDDQIVPLNISSKVSVTLVPGAQLKVYKGGSHAIAEIQYEEVNRDILEFIEAQAETERRIPKQPAAGSQEVQKGQGM